MAFALIEEDTLLDAIPSSEITGVFDINQNAVATKKSMSLRLVRKEKTESNISNIDVTEHLGLGQMNTSTNILQIQTLVDGYNSGRTYHFRTSTQEECTNLARAISKKSKVARKAVEARTRFEKYQKKVRTVVKSTPYQCFVAFLIGAVTPRAHLPRVPIRLRPTAEPCDPGPVRARTPKSLRAEARG